MKPSTLSDREIKSLVECPCRNEGSTAVSRFQWTLAHVIHVIGKFLEM